MAYYALPSTISAPSHEFDRRSFYVASPHTYSDSDKPKASNFSNNLYEKLPHHPMQTADKASMSKNRPRGESDLGKPELRTRPISTAHTLSAASPIPESTLTPVSEEQMTKNLPMELLTAVLVPLPFLLSSIVRAPSGVNHSLHASESKETEEIPAYLTKPTQLHGLLHAFALASGTLFLVGILGRVLGDSTVRDSKKTHPAHEKPTGPSNSTVFLSLTKLRQLGLRMISTALPFLAAAEIGGVRTGIFLLGSIATGLVAPDGLSEDKSGPRSWKPAFAKHKWMLLIFFASLIVDLFAFRRDADPSSTVRGYIALAKSTIFLQLPMALASSSSSHHHISPLIRSRQETDCTLIAGGLLGAATICLYMMCPAVPSSTAFSHVISLATIVCTAILLVWSKPASLRSRQKPGLLVGIFFCLAFHLYRGPITTSRVLPMITVVFAVYLAVQLDTNAFTAMNRTSTGSLMARRNSFQRIHQPLHASHFTRFILQYTKEFPLLHSILLDKESRRIVYFMAVNLAFMFVQTFYALLSGSLGLLSDSIHMLFDCVGLLAGLIASVMSKWPANDLFPYGYGKVETLSGLGNGIFLMIISVEIIWESLERFMEGAELHRLTELLAVSIGGLIVNCIGLIFIGHHHHHGHSHEHSHGHSHVHSHEHSDAHGHTNGHMHKNKQNSHEHVRFHGDAFETRNDEATPKEQKSLAGCERTLANGISESHQHDHSEHRHANENMAGIYLHILADTMGSVAVIGSTLLTKYTGWSGWDPIASCIIAVLIIVASYPLVVGSARQLLLTVPSEVEYALRSALQELSGLRGVSSYAVPRFWLNDTETQPHVHSHDQEHNEDHRHEDRDKHGDCHNAPSGRKMVGVIHVIATHNADLEDVRIRVGEFLRSRKIEGLVHVEREGNSQCWCGGAVGKSGHARNRSTVAM